MPASAHLEGQASRCVLDSLSCATVVQWRQSLPQISNLSQRSHFKGCLHKLYAQNIDGPCNVGPRPKLLRASGPEPPYGSTCCRRSRTIRLPLSAPSVHLIRKLQRESKKGATLTMPIILSILDRFAKFFHCCKEQ